jgi:hypothetical protein
MSERQKPPSPTGMLPRRGGARTLPPRSPLRGSMPVGGRGDAFSPSAGHADRVEELFYQVADLPAVERAAWQQLWADVARALARGEAKAPR